VSRLEFGAGGTSICSSEEDDSTEVGVFFSVKLDINACDQAVQANIIERPEGVRNVVRPDSGSLNNPTPWQGRPESVDNQRCHSQECQ